MARPGLKGAADQKPAVGFEVYHFEETRPDDDVSVDRLGRTSVERAVIGYLKPRVAIAAASFREPRVFSGWAMVRARHIRQPTRGKPLILIASPVESIEGQPDSGNRFHAHIERPQGIDNAYWSALIIREIFNRDGSVVARPPKVAWTLFVRWIKWQLRLIISNRR